MKRSPRSREEDIAEERGVMVNVQEADVLLVDFVVDGMFYTHVDNNN